VRSFLQRVLECRVVSVSSARARVRQLRLVTLGRISHHTHTRTHTTHATLATHTTRTRHTHDTHDTHDTRDAHDTHTTHTHHTHTRHAHAHRHTHTHTRRRSAVCTARRPRMRQSVSSASLICASICAAFVLAFSRNALFRGPFVVVNSRASAAPPTLRHQQRRRVATTSGHLVLDAAFERAVFNGTLRIGVLGGSVSWGSMSTRRNPAGRAKTRYHEHVRDSFATAGVFDDVIIFDASIPAWGSETMSRCWVQYFTDVFGVLPCSSTPWTIASMPTPA
jgi:hypothetical protein